MNGADCLLKTLAEGGVDTCFANAGTTELELAAAFGRCRGIRPVLGLFEGVCTGAADGYARMKGKPAMTLLHLGPGLANGIANLHNAKRARSPIVNVVGDHATWHVAADAPLAMDIEGLARTFSVWHRMSGSAADVARDAGEALRAAAGGGIATLIVPQDVQWDEAPEAAASVPGFSFVPSDTDRIGRAAKLLRTAGKAALILDGRALSRRGQEAATRVKCATGCDLFAASSPSCAERGTGLPSLRRIAYFPEDVERMLAPYDTAILADAHEPVAFFAYQGGKSRYLDRMPNVMQLSEAEGDAARALEALADLLQAPAVEDALRQTGSAYKLPELPSGPLTAEKACQTVAALQPEGAIIVDEGLTSTGLYFSMAGKVRPHTYMTLTGGAIGQGLPCATGAAVACPERPVINLQADGSAMYTVQALWTQARERADVTTLIFSNRRYAVIDAELLRAGYASADERTRSLTDLGNPNLDWVRIGEGMGVASVSVGTAERLAGALKKALAESGPHLIEMVL